MSESYRDWKTAHSAAVTLARKSGKDVGIEKMRQFGSDVYLVHRLPAERFRQGYELRCEVVRPTDPF